MDISGKFTGIIFELWFLVGVKRENAVCCNFWAHFNLLINPGLPILLLQASYSRQSSTGSTSSNTQAPPTSSNVSAHSQALFLQKVRESNEAVNCGDFRRAIKAYTEAITLDPTNHVLYTNRSTAFAKIQQFQKSLLDARKARELNPKWAKVGQWLNVTSE